MHVVVPLSLSLSMLFPLRNQIIREKHFEKSKIN